MKTNTEHRRRETDKLDQVCMKYQLEKANARIADLELEVYELEGFCHLIRREINVSQDIIYFSVMRINEALDRVMPPAAAKEGE